jgi:hypothetical protein
MHLPLATVLSALPSMNVKIYSFASSTLMTQNHKSKKYKSFLQTFVGRQIVAHYENWPARVRSTIGVVRMETIHR